MRSKGNSLFVISKFVKMKFGVEGYSRWFESLPSETKEIFHVLPSSSWYPVEFAMEIPIVKACELFYNGDKVGAHELGQYLAINDLDGIYSVFFRLGSISKMMLGGKILWQAYYDIGDYQLLESHKNRARVRFNNIPKRHRLWEECVAGFFEGIGMKLKVGNPQAVLTQSTNDVDNPGYFELALSWE
jgi:hypothetical protein